MKLNRPLHPVPRQLMRLNLQRSHWIMLGGILVGLAFVVSEVVLPGAYSGNSSPAVYSTQAGIAPVSTPAAPPAVPPSDARAAKDGALSLPSYTPESSGVPLVAEQDWPSLLLDLGGKLLLTLALFYALLYLLRKHNSRTTSQQQVSRFNIAATLQMGQHRSLHIVRVGDRQLLVGVTPSQISFIADVSSSPATSPEVGLQPEPNGLLQDHLASLAVTNPFVDKSVKS